MEADLYNAALRDGLFLLLDHIRMKLAGVSVGDRVPVGERRNRGRHGR